MAARRTPKMGPGSIPTTPHREGTSRRALRYTVEAGRQIYRDGLPFVSIGREGDTVPAVADEVTHAVADALNRMQWETKWGTPWIGGSRSARGSVREHGPDNEEEEIEQWIDAPDNEAPFLAQHWYSGQGDPLYALSSTGFPQPESTISWALRNAKASETEQWKHFEKKYGKKGAQKLIAIDPESREARALSDEKREDLEATDEISRLVYALQEALDHGERFDETEGLKRQGVAPGTRWRS